jgi:dienelactone hydrolase
MAEVVLFHHAQGLTPGVVAFADRLRAARHLVHTPDLYDGHTFETLDEGLGYAKVVGFSLGVLPAQRLAQTRPGARGALLFESCVPTSEFGSGWPAGVPVQVHGAEEDPFFAGEGDIDAARALVAEAEAGELFLYPGDRHLFADSSLSTYDAPAADLLTQRVLDFLRSI